LNYLVLYLQSQDMKMQIQKQHMANPVNGITRRGDEPTRPEVVVYPI